MRLRLFLFSVIFSLAIVFNDSAAASSRMDTNAQPSPTLIRQALVPAREQTSKGKARDLPIIYVQENISGEAEWTPDFVYVIDRDIRILSKSRLVIQAGTIVKFMENARLLVEGSLQARGTDQAGPFGGRVVFTSFQDDRFGGDTNGDGSASAPAPGDWGWIKFEDSSLDSESFLEHSLLLYGGKYHLQNDELRGVLFLESASPSIRSNILHANTNGIWLEGSSTPEIRGNLFYHNEGLAIVNENKVRGKPVIVTAEDNWWGHASGPQDPTDDKKDPTGLVNTLGRGSLISDMVDYDPWLTLPPEQAYLEVFEDAFIALPGGPMKLSLLPETQFQIYVPAACAPVEAKVHFKGSEVPLTGPDPNHYWSAALEVPPVEPQETISLTVDLHDGGCGDQSWTLADMGVIPPTGTVTDAQTGEPIAGARVTLHYYDWKGKSAYYWPGSRYGQPNPQTTGEQGWFGWSAPAGQYAIEVEMPGYNRYQSDWITTPLGTGIEIDLEPEDGNAPVYVPYLIR